MNSDSTGAELALHAENSSKTTYRISDLAGEFRITTRTIRFYEDQGLISPARVSGQRIYSQRDYTRLRLILRGKRLGFSLSEIRDMLDLYDSEPGEAAQLRVALEKSRERKAQLEQQLIDLQITLGELAKFEHQCELRLRELEK